MEASATLQCDVQLFSTLGNFATDVRTVTAHFPVFQVHNISNIRRHFCAIRVT